MAVRAAPFPNVYAEIGTTFASSVITFPTVCAHGSRITPELKHILEYPGFAAAPADTQFAQYSDDNLAKIKQAYAEAGGTRSNTRYGWLRTRV